MFLTQQAGINDKRERTATEGIDSAHVTWGRLFGLRVILTPIVPKCLWRSIARLARNRRLWTCLGKTISLLINSVLYYFLEPCCWKCGPKLETLAWQKLESNSRHIKGELEFSKLLGYFRYAIKAGGKQCKIFVLESQKYPIITFNSENSHSFC